MSERHKCYKLLPSWDMMWMTFHRPWHCFISDSPMLNPNWKCFYQLLRHQRFIIVTREVITFITFTIILLIQPIKANVLSNLLRIRTLYHNFSWYICTTLPMRLVEPRSIKRQQNNGVCKVATANTSHHANSDLTTWERCEKWMEDTEVPWLQFSTKQSTLAIFAFTLDYKVIAFVETTRLHCLGSQRRICEGRVELHHGKQLYVCQFKFYIFY